MKDYLVIGSGLAGISFCRILQKNKKSFLLYDDGSQQSSTVASGLYNPVTLKRFTPVWKAKEQLAFSISFYEELERDFSIRIHHKIPIYRKFASVEEQNLWFEASDKEALKPYLATTLIKNKNPCINAPFSFGEVLYTGKIDVAPLQYEFKKRLQKDNLLIAEKFEHRLMQISSTGIIYKNNCAKNIVFCEGFGLLKNPLFNYLPLEAAKGELLTITAPLLKLNEVIKSSLFIIPLGEDQYKIGATYVWDDETNTITAPAREELTMKLKTLISCDFTVIHQEAGIRPTVVDRKPLVGTHPTFPNIYILNGLGTRGVLMAPFAAQQLYHLIAHRIPIPKEIDSKRFEAKYFTEK
jgi:glycine oxidase